MLNEKASEHSLGIPQIMFLSNQCFHLVLSPSLGVNTKIELNMFNFLKDFIKIYKFHSNLIPNNILVLWVPRAILKSLGQDIILFFFLSQLWYVAIKLHLVSPYSFPASPFYSACRISKRAGCHCLVKGRKAFVAVVSRKFDLQFQIKSLSFCRHRFVHIIEEDACFLLKDLKYLQVFSGYYAGRFNGRSCNGT